MAFNGYEHLPRDVGHRYLRSSFADRMRWVIIILDWYFVRGGVRHQTVQLIMRVVWYDVC